MPSETPTPAVLHPNPFAQGTLSTCRQRTTHSHDSRTAPQHVPPSLPLMLLFQHYCPTCSPRSPQNYDEYGRLIAKYPKDHLINSNTPGYTGTAHFPANIVAIGDGNGNRQLSTADAESALLEAAKAGAHEALDSSTLEDSSLPALMTEI